MDAILTQDIPYSSPPVDLVAEANHRIANCLAVLTGVVRMQALTLRRTGRALSPQEACAILDGIAMRIGGLSQMHRILSHTTPDGAVSLRPHLQAITDALIAALSSPDRPVQVLHSGGDCMVLMRHVQPIILILCEIFLNAVKYAHPAGLSLIMTVDCTPTPDGRLVIACTDDGVGLPEGFDIQTDGGMGFRVIRGLASEIGADLQVISSSLGLTFRLALPAGTATDTKLS